MSEPYFSFLGGDGWSFLGLTPGGEFLQCRGPILEAWDLEKRELLWSGVFPECDLFWLTGRHLVTPSSEDPFLFRRVAGAQNGLVLDPNAPPRGENARDSHSESPHWLPAGPGTNGFTIS